MRWRLAKLQKNNPKVREFKTNLSEVKKDEKGVLCHESLPYIFEIICFEIISHHHNDPLVNHCEIQKN